MANEITTVIGLSLANGSMVDDMTTITQTPDQSTAAVYSNTQTIGTSEEALVVGADIATPGWFYARNLDPTNYLEIGLTGAPMAHLKPGEECAFRMSAGITLYAIANTSPCVLFYKIYDT